MIRAQELRIGNLVKNDGCICEIMHLYGGDFINCTLKTKQGNNINAHYKLIQPIPLTEEWLLKAGFNKFPSTQYDRDDFWCLEYIERKGHAYYNQFWCNQLEIYIKYVHQLQNIYFCLTGEELNINL